MLRGAILEQAAIPPELRLLLACASANPTDDSVLRAAVERVADWESLLQTADYHGLLPILASTLGKASAVPPNIAQRLRDSHRVSAQRALFYSGKLRALIDGLKAEGVSALPLKGPWLAESLYPDPAWRPFSDLDILVHPRHVEAALRFLAREGYVRAPHLAWVPVENLLALDSEVIVRHPLGIQVDLQWAVARVGNPFRFDPEILWRSSRPDAPALTHPEAPTLTPESLLLFLCVHGAKHVWGRLMWLSDVARLTRKNPDWVAALRLASDAACERPVLLGLLLARDVLDAPVPDWILERALSDATIPPLARQVVSNLLSVLPNEPDVFEETAFNAKMASTRWDKICYYAALFRPFEPELELLRLPPKLFYLYFPVKVLRLTPRYVRRMFKAGLGT